MTHLRVGEDLFERRDGSEADVDVAELGHPFGERFRAKRGAEEGEQLLAPAMSEPVAADVGGEAA